ncbi:MAG: sulfatase-like hydrolase/transferase [Acidobacteriota bacterium]|nr:sulfatase-like hydrolase/transferase [Acidobacteriota bacterium]
MLALLAACLFLAAAPASAPSGRPAGIVLITLDTTRADHLGCYGRSPSPTPNLDVLAAAGVRFDQALSPAPLTLPAHASVMTGLPPRLHGARDNGERLPPGVKTLAEALADAGWQTAAVVGSAVLDRATGIDRGFAVFDDQVRQGPRRWFDWRERAASQVVDRALEEVARLESPFLLWVHLYDPHLPWVAPEPWRSRFEGHPYQAEIAFADDQLGRLLAAVRRRWPAVLVAVAGDHGESLGEHGEKDHGVLLFQTTQRVPLILAGPSVPAGRVVRTPVGLVDLAPTLLRLAGVKVPKTMEGRPLIDDGRVSAPADRAFEMEALHGARAYGWRPLAGVVKGRFKLLSAGRPHLYDLAADPAERRDLATTHPRVVAALVDRLPALDGAAAPGEETAADTERLATLRSLGYAAGAPPLPGDRRPDPLEAVASLQVLHHAREVLAAPDADPRALAQATTRLEHMLADNPANLPARLTLGNLWLARGQVARAITVYEQALRRAADDDRVHQLLGRAWRARRPVTEESLATAAAAFRRALELRPRNPEATGGLAETLIDLGRADQALAVLDQAAARDVEDPRLLLLRGSLLAAAGRGEPALQAFRRALELDPTDAAVLEAMGKLSWTRGRPGQAADYYRQALAAAPRPELARTLGSIYLALENIPAARQAFETALRLDPDGREAGRIREILRELPR